MSGTSLILACRDQVYFPCVLQAKKRYVGFKYENPDDAEPVFDDKGIETVRRDGVPAQQKQLEACIKCVAYPHRSYPAFQLG
jgi:DNA polymerase elongation subunit (family B)